MIHIKPESFHHSPEFLSPDEAQVVASDNGSIDPPLFFNRRAMADVIVKRMISLVVDDVIFVFVVFIK